MTQGESLLDAVFQEFKSAYSQADPEARSRVAAQLSEFANEHTDGPGISRISGATGRQTVLTGPGGPMPAESEICLRQMAENIEQVIWIRDLRSGGILYVSPAFEMVWGRSCQSFYDHPDSLIETVHPEDRLQVMVGGPNNDRQPTNQEYRIIRPDGSLRWILARTFLVREDVKPSYRLVCIAQDITNQKKIEMALRKALDRTQEQFTLSRKMSLARKPEAVLKALMSARELRSVERAALLFFDKTEDEPVRGIESVATWQASQHLDPWERELALYEEPALWELFQSHKPTVFSQVQQDSRLTPTIQDLLQDGEIQSFIIFPLVALGNWIGVLLVFFQEEHQFDSIELRHLKVLVDQATITLYNLQLLEVEEDLRHEAERANEIKTQFLAMISHELRTPLTSIIGFTTTLLADDVVWEPEEERDFIHTIRQEANRLQELIDHLLDLSRLEAGMLPIASAPQSIREIIEQTLPLMRALTGGQEILLHLPSNLPLVQVDVKRIAQVLTNLAQNAAIYASRGKEIIISAALRKDYVQVSVADEGPGFPADERKSAFEAFRRGAHEDNRPGKGAGLGLAICKRLIEAQGGRIWIKKQTGPGATVCFTVPIARQQPAPANSKGED
jgi:PAS domain S-box-containing protein